MTELPLRPSAPRLTLAERAPNGRPRRDHEAPRAGSVMGVTWAYRGRRPRDRISGGGMEINANRRANVDSQRRDLPLSVMPRIRLDGGRERGAGGRRAAAQARRDGVQGPQHIASILRKGLEPAPAREGRFLGLGCCRWLLRSRARALSCVRARGLVF